MKLLVVAAWEPEMVRFRASSTQGPREGVEVVCEAIGVGLVESALGMTRCVARHAPDLALLLGTAGALPRGPGGVAIGEVVVASAARIVDAGILDRRSALPAPMPASVSLDAAMHDALLKSGAKSVQIANTMGITVDDALAASLAAGGDHVEHLEAFAFARACAIASVRCGIVLGIANVVGARGRAEWLANHVQASAAAADLAFAALPLLL